MIFGIAIVATLIWSIPLLALLIILAYISDLDNEGCHGVCALIAFNIYMYFVCNEMYMATINSLLELNLVVLGLIYIIIGVLWSFIKFRIEVKKFLVKRASYTSLNQKFTAVVVVSMFSSRLVKWIAYWPLNIFTTLIKDILADFWKSIVKMFNKVYIWLAESVISKISNNDNNK